MNHLDGLCQAVKEHKPNEAWLVADLRISRAVREAIKQYTLSKEIQFSLAASEAIKEYRKQRDLALFSYIFDELIDEGVNFKQYFNWLEEQLQRRGINDKTYIPLACSKQEAINPTTGEPIASIYADANGCIDGYIDRWLDDPDKKHISVLGEFGTGKTWFCFPLRLDCSQNVIKRRRSTAHSPTSLTLTHPTARLRQSTGCGKCSGMVFLLHTQYPPHEFSLQTTQ